jgi:hypothetical protein
VCGVPNVLGRASCVNRLLHPITLPGSACGLDGQAQVGVQFGVGGEVMDEVGDRLRLGHEVFRAELVQPINQALVQAEADRSAVQIADGRRRAHGCNAMACMQVSIIV